FHDIAPPDAVGRPGTQNWHHMHQETPLYFPPPPMVGPAMPLDVFSNELTDGTGRGLCLLALVLPAFFFRHQIQAALRGCKDLPGPLASLGQSSARIYPWYRVGALGLPRQPVSHQKCPGAVGRHSEAQSPYLGISHHQTPRCRRLRGLKIAVSQAMFHGP